MSSATPKPCIAIVDGGSFVLPYDVQLIGALLRSGFVVDFYGSETRYNAEWLQVLRGMEGVEVHAFAVSGSVTSRGQGALAYLKLWMTLWRRRARYTRVNLQFSALWPLEWPFLFMLRRRLVFTVHNAVPHGFKGERHAPTAWIAGLAQSLAFVSTFSRDEFLRRYGQRSAAKSQVLPHGLMPVLPNQPPVPYQARPRADVLIFWSTVKPYKGVELFTDLARAETIRARRFALEVQGAWAADLHPLRDELVSLGVTVVDAYLAPGPLQTLLARDAWFVLPYREASQSGALYTLLHQGRLFLCADVGDLGDFMRRHGLQGLLLKERSATAVLACLDYFEAHRDALLQAFQAAQQACAWEAVATDVQAVYGGG